MLNTDRLLLWENWIKNRFRTVSRTKESAIPGLGKRDYKHIKLKGEVRTPINLPSGCVFHECCLFANDRCVKEIPHLNLLDSGAQVACHGVEEGRL